MSYPPPGNYPPQDAYPPAYNAPPPGTYPQANYSAPLPGQPGYQWGATGAFPFAGFGARLGAALLDGVIVGIPIGIVYGIVAALSLGTLRTGVDPATGQTTVTGANGGAIAIGVILFAIVVVAAFLYEPLLTARRGLHNGQTYGKQVLGIRIVSTEGGPISTGQAWGRYLFKSFISGSILFLGYLWMLWDIHQQTWHDKVANTLVVKA